MYTLRGRFCVFIKKKRLNYFDIPIAYVKDMYLLCIINSTEHLTHTEMKTIAYSLSPKETILTDDELVTYWIPSNLCDSDDVNLALSEWRNRLFNNSNFGWKLPKNFGRIRIAGRISELEVLLQHYQYRQNNE